MWHADPTRPVHEPVQFQLPALPTAPAQGPLVSTDDAADDVVDGVVRLTVWVHGRVQGVGFRWWTSDRAQELGLAGSARNEPDGTVEVVVEGSRAACTALLDALRSRKAPGHVVRVVERWGDARGVSGFTTR